MTPPCPYKGLVPYSEEDAPFFFGRESDRDLIIANLLASRFTLLYGPSGVGKSSVLGAGVVHHLKKLADANVVESGIPKNVPVLFRSWRDEPLVGLTQAISNSVSRYMNGNGARLNLSDTLTAWSVTGEGDLLLILDQFEDYFLYHQQDEGPGTLAGELPEIIARKDWRVSVLISVREDALAKLDRFEGRISGLFENYLRIDHLDLKAARAALVKPVERFNHLHQAAVRIEPELVNAVLEGVKIGRVQLDDRGRGAVDEAEADEVRIESPYLQLVMTRIWEEESGQENFALTHAALGRLGGVEKIVKTHLDVRMASFSAREQEAAAEVFHYLVTPSGSKIAHSASDLAKYSELPEAEVFDVLEGLCSARILQNDASRYEIYHDVLGPAILDWRRRYTQAQELKLAETRAAEAAREQEAESTRIREIEQVRAIAAEQERRARESARSATRMRRMSAALLVGVFLLAATAFSALTQRRRAQEEAQRAAKNESAARESRDHAFAAAQEAKKANEAAIEAAKAAENARQAAILEARVAQSREYAAAAINNLDLDPQRSLLYAIEAVTATYSINQTATRQAEEALHYAVQNARLRLVFPHGHGPAGVTAAALSGNGRLAATAGDKRVRLWDAVTGKPGGDLPEQASDVTGISLDRSGALLAICRSDGIFSVWSTHPPKELYSFPAHSGGSLAVRFSPDGTRIAVAGVDGLGSLWDTRSGRRLTVLKGHAGQINDITFSPISGMVATAGTDQTVRLWDPRSGKELARLSRPQSQPQPKAPAKSPSAAAMPALLALAPFEPMARIQPAELFYAPSKPDGETFSSVSFSIDGTLIAASSWNAAPIIWEVATGGVLIAYAPGPKRSSSPVMPVDLVIERLPSQSVLDPVRFGAEGWLAGAKSPGVVQFRTLAGADVFSLRSHTQRITDLDFSSDRKLLLTASVDGSAKLWEAAPEHEWLTIPAAQDVINQAVFSPDQKHILTSGRPPRVWDAVSGRLIGVLGNEEGIGVAISRNGQRMATAENGAANIWDASTRKLLMAFPKQGSRLFAVAFNPDGKTLATGGDKTPAQLWDAATGRALRTFAGHPEGVISLAFDPAGKRLATAAVGANLWDPVTGRLIVELASERSEFMAVAFSPDGKLVAGAGSAGVKLWDAASGRLLRGMSGHNGKVLSVAFSPDGKVLASGGTDGTVRFWDVGSGREALSLSRGFSSVWSLDFSGDGKRLLASDQSGKVYVLAVHLEDLLAMARARITRQLTGEEKNALTSGSAKLPEKTTPPAREIYSR